MQKKRYLLIFLVLALIVPLIFLFVTSSKQEPTSPEKTSSKWQSYDTQVADGSLKKADKILEVLFTYNAVANPELKIHALKQQNGYVPAVHAADHTYRLQLLNENQEVLTEQPFTIPNQVNAETIGPDGMFQGNTTSLPTVDFAQTVTWHEDARLLRIVTADGIELLRSGLDTVKFTDNKPTFDSIQGDQLLKMPSKKDEQSFRLPIPQAAAQATDGKIDIAILSDKYTDFTLYQNDINFITTNFLQYQPFKTRASQFAFHKIDNTDNLGCVVQAQPTLPSCDASLVTQRVNQAGVPNDYIIVLIAENSVNIGGGIVRGNQIMLLKNPGWNQLLGGVMAHEMGHAIGKLLEEYKHPVFGQSNGVIDNQMHVIGPSSGETIAIGDGNCYAGTPPATAWNAHDPPVGIGDYKVGCTYPNWYAPSKFSVMNAPGIKCFNAVSQRILNRRLDIVVGPFSGGTPPLDLCPELQTGYMAPTVVPTTEVPVPSAQCMGGAGVPPCATFAPSIVAPITGGASPTTNPNPNPSATQSPPTPTSAVDPCSVNQASILTNNKKKKHMKNKGGGGFLSKFFKLLFRLIEQLLRLIGVQIPGNPIPNPGTPCPDQLL